MIAMTYPVLQKSITILRKRVNRPAGKFEYQVLKDGTVVLTHTTDLDGRYAAVSVNRDGNMWLDSIKGNMGLFEPYILEDNWTYIIPITNIN
jgi:hypothetical protein